MMTGAKVILTYKRKKPSSWIAYKRRRISSRKDFSEENECPGTYNTSIPAGKGEESAQGNERECPKQDCEQVYLAPGGKASRVENENHSLQNMMELTPESLTVLDGSPGNNISQKASENQLPPDAHEMQKTICTQGSSGSFVTSSPASDERSTITCSVALAASSSIDLHNSNLKTNYNYECTFACSPDKNCLKETGLSVEDKSSSERNKAAIQSKLRSPLITFRRRCKPNKKINGLVTENVSDVKSDGTLRSARVASAKDEAHSILGSMHASITSTNVESSCAVARSSPESGSFKPADHKMENAAREDTCSVEVLPQTTEVNVCSIDKNVGLHFQDPSGNSSTDATVQDPALEPVLSNHHSSIGKESQILSTSGLNTERGTNDVPCGRGSMESLDLSVPPPDVMDPPEVMDREITAVPYEKPVCASLYSPSGSRTTHLNNEPPGVMGLELLHENTIPDEKPVCTSLCSPAGSHAIHLSDEPPGVMGLELLHENIGVTHSYHQLPVLENGSHLEEDVKHNDFANSSPASISRNSYLQLFPEDRKCDLSHSTTMHQEVTADTGSGVRTVDPSEKSSQARTAEAKSSLFLGLFLPMDLINNGHNRSSTPSHWANGGMQSRESSLQDTVPQGFPDQSSTSLRHKMMLDKILNKARTPKRNRSSGLNLYGYPTMWSEKELDCLWIGVRRYGRGNWEAMLRDPRLEFSPWRTPWDLAQQWEEEQAKLFNSAVPFSQGNHFRTQNVSQDSPDGFWPPKIGNQNSVEDVQLSLGDVYSKYKDGVRQRALANFMDIQRNAPRQNLQTVASMRTARSYRSSHRRPVFLNNPNQDVACSVSAKNSTYIPPGRNFPHWLKELVAIPLMPPPQVALPTDTSATGPVLMPSANSCRINDKGSDHEPWNRISNKPAFPGGGELQLGAGVQNKPEQDPENERDLIVIDSDASSEETISDDDRSGKV